MALIKNKLVDFYNSKVTRFDVKEKVNEYTWN